MCFADGKRLEARQTPVGRPGREAPPRWGGVRVGVGGGGGDGTAVNVTIEPVFWCPRLASTGSRDDVGALEAGANLGVVVCVLVDGERRTALDHGDRIEAPVPNHVVHERVAGGESPAPAKRKLIRRRQCKAVRNVKNGAAPLRAEVVDILWRRLRSVQKVRGRPS